MYLPNCYGDGYWIPNPLSKVDSGSEWVSKVFLGDLSIIPPIREIVFLIGILPDTQPTSITLYRMSLSELKVLKDELRDLLGKGFIFPIIPQLEYSVVVC